MRIRIGLAKVERLEALGGAFSGLIRLWKCVENSEDRVGFVLALCECAPEILRPGHPSVLIHRGSNFYVISGTLGEYDNELDR